MKRLKKVSKKTSQKNFLLLLTSIQKTYLGLLTGKTTGYPLTPQQVAKERGVTLRAVNNMISKLENLGVFSRGYQKLPKSRVTHKPIFKGNSYIRRHAEHWNIKIVWSGNKYNKLLRTGNKIIIDNNTITIHPKTINIYSHQEFKADDVDKADYLAQEYWMRFFKLLENKLAVVILKEGRHNIKLCRIHYADVHNGIAERLRYNKEKLRIYDLEDGKLRIITDFSNLADELESQHPSKAPEDMKRIKKHNLGKKYIRDIIENDPPTNSELSNILKCSLKIQSQTQEQLKISAQALELVSKQLKTVVDSINALFPKETKKTEVKENFDFQEYIG